MVTCLVELYGIDGAASYGHTFTFLRQLAVHLRGALTAAAADAPAAFAAVASWPVLACLRALTAIVCAHGCALPPPAAAGGSGGGGGGAPSPAPPPPLSLLLFPLVQVLSGLARLCAPPRAFPLRLHACALLNELAWATGAVVPVAPLLLEVLRAPLFERKPRGAAPTNPTPLAFMIKAGPASLDTRATQEALVSRAFELLGDALRAHFCTLALPEVAAAPLAALRAYAAQCRVPPWKARARAIVEAVAAEAARVAAARAGVTGSPCDPATGGAFMEAERRALRGARAAARAAADANLLRAAEEAAQRVGAARGQQGATAGEVEEDEDEDEGGEDGEDGGGEEEGGEGAEEEAASSAPPVWKRLAKGKAKVKPIKGLPPDAVEDLSADLF
jgi:nucleolar complex protein 2